jgi:putative salt-induced outer membrane protein YdiY
MRIIECLRVAIALLATVATLGFAEGDAQLDEVVLKDGSLVRGVITGARDGVVTVETKFAGSIGIKIVEIESVSRQETGTLMFSDGTILEDQPLVVDNGQLQTSSGERIDLSELKVVNPAPWEMGEGYKWSGLVNFALEIERGNSDKDELDYKLDTEWLSTRDRWGLLLQGENDEANGEKSADNWLTELKYDYFISTRTYTGVLLRAEEDRFSDIDLRYMIGPHIGHAFFTDPVFSLSGEVGAAYTHEEFVLDDEEDYAAATWGWKASSNYLGGDSKLYINQRGFMNLDETDDITFDTTIGLAFPLLWGLEAAAEILYEYDNEVADGIDELDETYKIRIGYGW